ncbi:MAG: tRNA (adenosine(37)-N6)-threonylcarbamoyltransferase complex dimerization subunit type 1 TsaB [Endozoicomonadaceae bacterium]|nr:tRNA (adenosine(37)-N6)-threonylcarbamoyltransferase complex dimerization subunit type 1 TsaB [Endozoicomonadaceae bacterium]
MPRILALDTATEACSVAVYLDGEVREHFDIIPRQHSQRILPMIKVILAEHGLSVTAMDAIAFGRGPGAFTGVRIATGIAQGLAFAADLPVIPVSTLAALSQLGLRQYGAQQVLAAIDARMSEIYQACYTSDDGVMVLQGSEQVCAPEAVSAAMPGMNSWVGVGTGWQYRDRIALAVNQCYPDELPHAADIALLASVAFASGDVVAAEQALPVYLRNDVAKKKHER